MSDLGATNGDIDAPALTESAVPDVPVQESVEASVQESGVLNTLGGFLLILVPTAIAGFIDFMSRGVLGVIAGITFVVCCLLTAILIRQRDLWTAVISPPLAFLLALIIAGQKDTLDGTGQLIVREASLILTGLALGAPWLFGGTLIALAVVLVRRSR